MLKANLMKNLTKNGVITVNCAFQIFAYPCGYVNLKYAYDELCLRDRTCHDDLLL